MVADKLLELCNAQAAGTALTGTAIDLKQEHPNLGSMTPPFVMIITPAAVAGTAPITFNLQDSADGSSDWKTIATTTITADDFTEQAVVPLPVQHRRYLRLATTVDTSSSKTATGTFSAVLNNVYELKRTAKVEGFEIVKTID